MSIAFDIRHDDDVVVITVSGDVVAEDINSMRARTMSVLEDTGIQNWYVDLAALRSLAFGRTLAAFELGEKFASTHFPYTTRTAVRLPDDPAAREQAKFMHTVELNRGRGVMRYVESLEEAIAWLQS